MGEIEQKAKEDRPSTSPSKKADQMALPHHPQTTTTGKLPFSAPVPKMYKPRAIVGDKKEYCNNLVSIHFLIV